jgi:hypothetical protein
MPAALCRFESSVAHRNRSGPHRGELLERAAPLLQLPSGWTRVLYLPLASFSLGQAVLFVRWYRSHPGRMPQPEGAGWKPKVLCKRVSHLLKPARLNVT